jgi:hypothetical protein
MGTSISNDAADAVQDLYNIVMKDLITTSTICPFVNLM